MNNTSHLRFRTFSICSLRLGVGKVRTAVLRVPQYFWYGLWTKKIALPALDATLLTRKTTCYFNDAWHLRFLLIQYPQIHLKLNFFRAPCGHRPRSSLGWASRSTTKAPFTTGPPRTRFPFSVRRWPTDPSETCSSFIHTKILDSS